MRLQLLIVLSLAAACSARTEIVLGAATDLKARNQVDEVRLIVSRDGVPVLQPPAWSLTDVPAGVYELPGSFGLYSPDGSEVKLEVQLQGFKDQTPVIERDSLFSLVAGKTLFTRLTLVSDCNPADAPACPGDQTCVEGVCRSHSADSHSFPLYVAGMEKKLQCQSGFNYVVSSTGEPMPVDGVTCPAGQYCQEGTCYTLPPGNADAGVPEGIWSDVQPPSSNLLHAVWQSPDGKDLFAVGDAGTIMHLHDDGPMAASSWMAEQSPVPANLYAIWGTSADDITVAGTYLGTGGILLHRSMGVWTLVSGVPQVASLRGLDGTSANDLWIVGVGPSRPEVLHWDGSNFTRDVGFAAAAGSMTTQLRAVAVKGSEVWVAGTGGVVGHFDGNWTVTQLDGGPDLHAIVALTPGEARVVGQGGFIAHLLNGTVTVESSPTKVDLYGLAARGADELVAVGDYGTILRGSNDTWTEEGSGTLAPLFAVWATSRSKLEFAVGGGGTVRSFTAPPCKTDADCRAGSYCNSDGTCVVRKPLGTACDATDHPGDATTCAQPGGCGGCKLALFCTDGVCCDSNDCTGCKACNAAGHCDFAPDGADPHGTCATATAECLKTTCNGSGSCGASGGSCGQNDCAAGFLTTHTCDNGTCVAVTPASQCPGVIACGDAHSCAAKCAADTDCDAASYCDSNGNCSPRKDVGAQGTCKSADCKVSGCRECKNGLSCTDGFCCTVASCAGACEACNATGACQPLANGTPPNSHSGGCPSSVMACKVNNCNGVSRTCIYPTGSCGSATCSGDSPVSAPHCSAGACIAGSTGTSCSPWGCSAGACNATCVTNGAGCASDAHCNNLGGDGPPQPTCQKNQGASCQNGGQCQTNTCSQGKCCDTTCSTFCDYTTDLVYSAPSCATGTCTPGGSSAPCPNGFQCGGPDSCYTYCYTVWVGGFPASGFPNGLNFGGCASSRTPYCNCIPGTSGGNCMGTKCCATFPCN